MRGFVLAVVAIQMGLAQGACAENSADAAQSVREALPLFDENHCGSLKDPADQLFCGDPELSPRDQRKRGMDQAAKFELRHLWNGHLKPGPQADQELSAKGNDGKN
jgi:hypothetical protein